MRLSTLKKEEEIRSVMKFLYGDWTPLKHESDSAHGYPVHIVHGMQSDTPPRPATLDQVYTCVMQ